MKRDRAPSGDHLDASLELVKFIARERCKFAYKLKREPEGDTTRVIGMLILRTDTFATERPVEELTTAEYAERFARRYNRILSYPLPHGEVLPERLRLKVVACRMKLRVDRETMRIKNKYGEIDIGHGMLDEIMAITVQVLEREYRKLALRKFCG